MISLSEISNLYIATCQAIASIATEGLWSTTHQAIAHAWNQWSICVKQIDIEHRKNGCLRWFSMKLIGLYL